MCCRKFGLQLIFAEAARREARCLPDAMKSMEKYLEVSKIANILW
jgi:hypothetical protein